MNKYAFYILTLLSGAIVLFYLLNSHRGGRASRLSGRVGDKSLSVQQTPDLNNSVRLPKRSIWDLSAAEIQAQLEKFKDISDIHQKTLFEALLRRWTKLDEQGAFQYVNSLEDGEIKWDAITVVAEVIAPADPQFLAQSILFMPVGHSSGILIHALVNAWSQTDAKSALAWAEQLPEGSDKQEALVTIRFQLASQDPEAAAEQVAHLAESDSTSALIAAIAGHWAVSNPSKAIEWASTLGESDKTLAMGNVMGVWARRDPVAAANYVSQLPGGEIQNEAARSVISSWAKQDPQATAAWVLEFPAGDLRDHGINVLVTDWNMSAPEKAQDWVLSLPEGAAQDAAFKSFAESIVYSINDPFVQEESMEVIIRSWSKNDPAAARNWLAGWNAAENLKTRLRSFLSPD